MKYASRPLLYGSVAAWVASWIAVPVLLVAVVAAFRTSPTARETTDDSTAYTSTIELRNEIVDGAAVISDAGEDAPQAAGQEFNDRFVVDSDGGLTVRSSNRTYSSQQVSSTVETLQSQDSQLSSYLHAHFDGSTYPSQIPHVLSAFQGYTNGDLGLEDNMSRAQGATVVAEVFDLRRTDTRKSINSNFSDVSPHDVHAYNINALYEQEITSGCATAPLRFCPTHRLSRRHFAVFFARALREKGFPRNGVSPNQPVFADVPASDSGFSEIRMLNNLGLLEACYTYSSGRENFCPDAAMSRGEAARVIARYYAYQR